MKGLVVGCSLACGYCAETTRTSLSMSWPHLVMNYIGISDIANKSLPGLSNKGIVRGVIDYVESTSEDLFVIISVTSDMRSMYDVVDTEYRLEYTYGNHMRETPGNIVTRIRSQDCNPSGDVYQDSEIPESVTNAFNVGLINDAHSQNFITPSSCETPAYMTYISSYLKEKQIKHLLVNAASLQYDNIVTTNKINSVSFKDIAVPPRGVDKLHPDVAQNREFFNLIKDQVRSRYDFRD